MKNDRGRGERAALMVEKCGARKRRTGRGLRALEGSLDGERRLRDPVDRGESGAGAAVGADELDGLGLVKRAWRRGGGRGWCAA